MIELCDCGVRSGDPRRHSPSCAFVEAYYAARPTGRAEAAGGLPVGGLSSFSAAELLGLLRVIAGEVRGRARDGDTEARDALLLIEIDAFLAGVPS